MYAASLGEIKQYPFSDRHPSPGVSAVSQSGFASVDQTVQHRVLEIYTVWKRNHSTFCFRSVGKFLHFLRHLQDPTRRTGDRVDAFEFSNLPHVDKDRSELNARALPLSDNRNYYRRVRAMEKLWESGIRRLPRTTRLVRFDLTCWDGHEISRVWLIRLGTYIRLTRWQPGGGARVEIVGLRDAEMTMKLQNHIPNSIGFYQGRPVLASDLETGTTRGSVY